MKTRYIAKLATIISITTLLGCASVPSKPVDLGSPVTNVGLRLIEDDRPVDAKISGRVREREYSGYRYGDEHFQPTPIVALDNAVSKELANSSGLDKVAISKFEIMDTRSVSKFGGSPEIIDLSLILIDAVSHEHESDDHLTCSIDGRIGSRNISANTTRHDDANIDTRLRLLTDECIASFAKQAVEYYKTEIGNKNH